MTASAKTAPEVRRYSKLSLILPFIYAFALFLLSYQEGLNNWAKIAGAGIVAVFFVEVAKGRIPIRIPVPYLIFFVWLMWAMISSIFAEDIDLAISKVTTLVQVVGVSFAVTALAIRQGSTLFLWAAVAVAALAAAAVTLTDINSYVDIEGRLAGTVGNANLFGLVLIGALTVCAAFGLVSESWLSRLGLLLISVFFVYLIAETGSRKGMLGALMSIFIVLFVTLQRLRRRNPGQFLIMGAVGLVLLLGGAFYFQSSTYSARVNAALDTARTGNIARADSSLRKRIDYIQIALEQSSKKPLLGHGLDNYRSIELGMFQETGTYSHSNYIEILVSTGMPGLIVWIIFHVSLLARVFSCRYVMYDDKKVALYAICAALIVIFAVFDFAMVSYYEKIWWFLVASAIAQLEIFRRIAAVSQASSETSSVRPQLANYRP